MADLDQPRRHCGTHPAEAGDSDTHDPKTPSSGGRVVATIGENGERENATLPAP
jgi:hypothetical protein